MHGPFTLNQARAHGVSRKVLRGRGWRRLGTELYCRAGVEVDPWKLLSARRGLLPGDAVFAGATAAWLHGIDLDPVHPIEVIVSADAGARSRTDLRLRRTSIANSEIATVRDLPATTIARTLVDLCRRLPSVEALVAIYAAVKLRLIGKATGGTRRFKDLMALAEPAESPMETRLRWMLLQAGLPRPEVQKHLHDATGRFIGRADLYYPVARLVIEYDGGNHRDRLVEDNRRQNLIVNAGFRMLRFTAADLHQRPDAVVGQVRMALDASAGLLSQDHDDARRSVQIAHPVQRSVLRDLPQ